MKSLFKIALVLGIVISVSSCRDKSKPNYQYMPNMYESVAYETYSESKAFNSPNAIADKAKELFDIYCAICHGTAGDGKGKLVKQEKFLGVPNYKERDINKASVFHVITYGLNSMGSHGNQLSANERWLVAEYVLKLKNE
jgi:mono/diheme cytochrome c family protein